jgi:hypothetical protein
LNIKKFAESYRLRTSKDADETTIISGRNGQIYEHSAGKFGVIYQPAKNAWKPKTWGNHRRRCEAAGMTVHQNGDSEGALLFDPKNGELAALAVKVAGCRPKKVISPEHLAKMRAGLNAAVLSA